MTSQEKPDAGKQETAKAEAQNRLSWEQIYNDPEYYRHIAKLLRDRMGEIDQERMNFRTLYPALRCVGEGAGMDPDHLDYPQLALYLITGLVPRPKVNAQEVFAAHFQKLQRQAQALKNLFPGFDLRRELENPLFLRLTSPGVGLSVEDAFHAVHRRQIQKMTLDAASRRAQELVANAVASGSHRPQEAGTAPQASSVSRFDYSKATPEQRRAIKDEIRRAAAEGRKVYPG